VKASSEFSKASASHASEEATSAAASATAITLEPEFTESPGPIVNQDAPTPVPVPDVPPPIATLEAQSDLQKTCLGPKTPTCLLAFLPAQSDASAEPTQEAVTALASLAELSEKHTKRGDHLFPFYAVPSSNTGGEALKTALGLGNTVEIIAINGKRSWWRHHDSSKGFGLSAIERWIDGIRLGEGKKSKLPEGVIAEEAQATSEPVSSSSTEAASEESPKSKIIHEDL
jgi:protein disulfide-isomerase A6